MGKVKRGRQRAHNAAVKIKSGTDNSAGPVEVVDMDTNQHNSVTGPPGRTNMFEGIDLSKFNLKTALPDFDACSTITSKSMKELKLKKKDKQKLRHDLWIQKLSAIDGAKKAAKDKKRRERTAVVGDIGVLGEALPTLELLLKGSTKPAKGHREQTKRKARGVETEKKRKQQMRSDYSIFQQVLKHPAFKENATGTISEHLQNRQKQEDTDP